MAEMNDNIIETMDEEGNVIKFELFDVIEFNEQEYALLLPVDEDEEDPEMVLMRVVTEGDEYSFETIDDEEEFEAVAEYIESFDEEE